MYKYYMCMNPICTIFMCLKIMSLYLIGPDYMCMIIICKLCISFSLMYTNDMCIQYMCPKIISFSLMDTFYMCLLCMCIKIISLTHMNTFHMWLHINYLHALYVQMKGWFHIGFYHCATGTGMLGRHTFYVPMTWKWLAWQALFMWDCPKFSCELNLVHVIPNSLSCEWNLVHVI